MVVFPEPSLVGEGRVRIGYFPSGATRETEDEKGEEFHGSRDFLSLELQS